jgi:two-component system, LytTR family, response regulator
VRLKTIIADDEPLALDLLEALLGEHPQVRIVARCGSGEDALAALNEHGADLMVLDIDMPGLGGLELVGSMTGPDRPMVIFATAHAEYAVEAFSAQATDYVLKPLDEARLAQAVDRAAALRTLRGTGAARPEAPPEAAVSIRQSGRTLLLARDEIVRAEASGDYLMIHTTERTHMVRMTIKALEDRLAPPDFFRIHRSAIVGAAHVREVVSQPKGDALVKMSDGASIRSSRTHREAIEAIIARHS